MLQGDCIERQPDHIVVAVTLSEEGRGLIQWTISRCQPGDVIYVLHVIVPPTDGARPPRLEEMREDQRRKLEIFSALLWGFEALCDEKKVAASVRVVHGACEEQAVADEARLLGATRVVVHKDGMGRRFSPRALEQRLPPACMVLFVGGGRLALAKRGKGGVGAAVGAAEGKSAGNRAAGEYTGRLVHAAFALTAAQLLSLSPPLNSCLSHRRSTPVSLTAAQLLSLSPPLNSCLSHRRSTPVSLTAAQLLSLSPPLNSCLSHRRSTPVSLTAAQLLSLSPPLNSCLSHRRSTPVSLTAAQLLSLSPPLNSCLSHRRSTPVSLTAAQLLSLSPPLNSCLSHRRSTPVSLTAAQLLSLSPPLNSCLSHRRSTPVSLTAAQLLSLSPPLNSCLSHRRSTPVSLTAAQLLSLSPPLNSCLSHRRSTPVSLTAAQLLSLSPPLNSSAGDATPNGHRPLYIPLMRLFGSSSKDRDGYRDEGVAAKGGAGEKAKVGARESVREREREQGREREVKAAGATSSSSARSSKPHHGGNSGSSRSASGAGASPHPTARSAMHASSMSQGPSMMGSGISRSGPLSYHHAAASGAGSMSGPHDRSAPVAAHAAAAGGSGGARRLAQLLRSNSLTSLRQHPASHNAKPSIAQRALSLLQGDVSFPRRPFAPGKARSVCNSPRASSPHASFFSSSFSASRPSSPRASRPSSPRSSAFNSFFPSSPRSSRPSSPRASAGNPQFSPFVSPRATAANPFFPPSFDPSSRAAATDGRLGQRQQGQQQGGGQQRQRQGQQQEQGGSRSAEHMPKWQLLRSSITGKQQPQQQMQQQQGQQAQQQAQQQQQQQQHLRDGSRSFESQSAAVTPRHMRVQRSASFAGVSAVAATLAQQLGWEHEAEAAEEEEERKAREQVRRGREVAQGEEGRRGEGQQSAQSELNARLVRLQQQQQQMEQGGRGMRGGEGKVSFYVGQGQQEEAMARADIASAARDAAIADRTEGVDCIDWANRCDVETASSSSSSSDDSSERGDANNADGLDDAIQGTVHHCSFPSMDASDAAQPVLESFCSDISATSAATSSSAFSSRSGTSSHWTDIPSSGSLSTPACHVSQQCHPGSKANNNSSSIRKSRGSGYLSDSALIPRTPGAKLAAPEKSPEAAPETPGTAGVRESRLNAARSQGRENLGGRRAALEPVCGNQMRAAGRGGEEARGEGNSGQENQGHERKGQDGKGHGLVGEAVARERAEAGEGKEDARCPVLVGRFPVHRPRQRAGVGGTMGGSVGGWSGGSGRRLSVLNKTRDPQSVRRIASESDRDRARDFGRVRREGSGIGSERGMCAPDACLLADGGSEDGVSEREGGESARDREWGFVVRAAGVGETGREREDAGESAEEVSADGEDEEETEREDGREADAGEEVSERRSSEARSEGREVRETSSGEGEGGRQAEGSREVESGAEGGVDPLPCVRQQSLPVSRSCSSLLPSRRYFSDGGEQARRDGRRDVPAMPQRAALGADAGLHGGDGWSGAGLGRSSSGGGGGVAARAALASPSPGVRRSNSFTQGARLTTAGAAAAQAAAGVEAVGAVGAGGAGAWEGPWRKLQWCQVEQATDGFATRNLLGTCGGYSRVYQGRLPGGQQIAVRREMLSCATTADGGDAGCGGAGGVIAAYGARQGGRPRGGVPLAVERGLSSEVAAELAVLATLSHRHVAQLVGVCAERRDEVALVFEHMEGGTLESALRGNSGSAAAAAAAGNPGSLPWTVRPIGARQLALALHYLHEGAPRAVVHRNVRAASVMLTRGGEVKLSEFGLALFAANNDAPMQVPLAGTFG
ncbi:unnamed protein product [Closterium sp. NIES-64]|nr:unnamed protein product [Closterium sp. NIES-64]